MPTSALLVGKTLLPVVLIKRENTAQTTEHNVPDLCALLCTSIQQCTKQAAYVKAFIWGLQEHEGCVQ